MIAWLWNVIVGHLCRHRWKVLAHCGVVNDDGAKVRDEFYLRCAKCGNMKRVKM